MEPKFGLTALQYMVDAIASQVVAAIGGSNPPYLALVTTGKTEFPTGDGQDYWAIWSDYEATFKGYARQMILAGDITGPPALLVDDEKMVKAIPEKVWEFDADAPTGAASEEIGWVALVAPDTGGTMRVVAAYPLDPTTMDTDGRQIRISFRLAQWSLPYPPA